MLSTPKKMSDGLRYSWNCFIGGQHSGGAYTNSKGKKRKAFGMMERE